MESKIFDRLMALAIESNKKLGKENPTEVTSEDLFYEFVGEYLVSFNNDLTDEEQYRLIDIFAAQCGMNEGEYDAFSFPFELMIDNYTLCLNILERSKILENLGKL